MEFLPSTKSNYLKIIIRAIIITFWITTFPHLFEMRRCFEVLHSRKAFIGLFTCPPVLEAAFIRIPVRNIRGFSTNSGLYSRVCCLRLSG
jgi:hypothetical protein